jgi:hypothetical protein
MKANYDVRHLHDFYKAAIPAIARAVDRFLVFGGQLLWPLYAGNRLGQTCTGHLHRNNQSLAIKNKNE